MESAFKRFGLLLVLILALSGATAHAQAPTVVSTSPAQGARNLEVSTNIEVTFDVDMDVSTINNSTFLVNGSITALRSGIYTYDGPTRTVTFVPDTEFAVNDLVTVVLTTGIQSSAGVPMASGFILTCNIYICGDVDGNEDLSSGSV